MTIRDTIREQITRLRVLWPTLNSRPEITEEVEKAVMRYESRITPEDVRAGFDALIEMSPTTGWPPGPSEVLGCVLQKASARKSGQPVRRREFGSGLTFAQWWHTLPSSERSQHETLRRMMDPEGKATSLAPDAAIEWGDE